MAYKVVFKASVRKDLRKVPKAMSVRILDAVEGDPASHPGKDKALKGQFASLFVYRVGGFRVVYSIQGETILVLRISYRKEAYRD